MIKHPSLDSSSQNSPAVLEVVWDSKQKRSFHKILSGLKKMGYKHEVVRFLTLTSASFNERLNADFGVLVKRIRKKFGRFDYYRVRTSEGNGVLHVLYGGEFIPQNWLSGCWFDITGDSYVVDVRVVDNRERRLARYVVSQHIAGQSLYVRSSMSWGWVYRGFVRDWRRIIKQYVHTRGIKYCVSLWDLWLQNAIKPEDDRHKDIKLPVRSINSWSDSRFWWCGLD